VFPHFRDLARQQASLKDYFADQQVQAYLEALPTDAEVTNEWAVINRQPFPQPPANNRRNNGTGVTRQFHQNQTPDPELPETPIRERPENSHFPPTRGNTSPTVTPSGSKKPEIPALQFPTSESVDRGNNYQMNGSAKAAVPSQTPKRRRRKPTQGDRRERVLDHRQHHPQQRRTFANTLEGKTRLVWMVFISLAGILVFWLLVSTTFGWLKNAFFPRPALQGEQLAVEINQPPISIPDLNSQPQPPEGPLTNTTAEEVIQAWLSTKAAALGPNHEIDNLEQILAGSALSQWRQIAQQVRSENHYRKYDHNLRVESVDKIGADADRAAVEATVKEITKFYENGQMKKSSDESLRVRYDLIRRDGVWRIQNMSVVNKITMNFL
jgi:hypothetical protein